MDGTEWTVSAMRAAQRRLEIATQNLANVATDGFRRSLAAIGLGDRGLTVEARPDPAQGGLRRTGRTFDLALAGPGAFRLAGGTTRNGAFSRSAEGRLVDDRGRAVLGARGPLRVPEGATIRADGAVLARGRVVDRIPLPAGTHVIAGALEASTVNPIEETLAIVEAQRAFETAEKTLAAIDATRRTAAADVAKLG